MSEIITTGVLTWTKDRITPISYDELHNGKTPPHIHYVEEWTWEGGEYGYVSLEMISGLLGITLIMKPGSFLNAGNIRLEVVSYDIQRSMYLMKHLEG